MKKLLVFTDLDGSLLNHDSYDWKQALPAIESLKQHHYPLIINSSKTSSEIKIIRLKMKNTDPFICENGAVVHFNESMLETSSDSLAEIYFAKPYAVIQQVLSEIKLTHKFKFTGFNELTVDNLMALTNLDKTAATAARQREATEPVVWNDTHEALDLFRNILNKHELTLTLGGRFYHVMSPVTKGDSIDYLLEKYQQMEPHTEWKTAGLGDSFNDISMLEKVDFPVLIKNPQSKKPDVRHIPNIIKTELAGPTGWNVAVLNIINTMTGKT